MNFENLSFGSIQIDGKTYAHDVAIDRGEIRKRRKKPSRKFRNEFGHTPLSVEEAIPWECRRLIVGTGIYGGLPVMNDGRPWALGDLRKIELVILPTAQAIEAVQKESEGTNAILHVTG
ncbi:MAG: hypothetical protein DMG24_00390 [Acidobacteria bacterium]|nr:MAG: hypothetical protein DMG24_00390 [Acidobacteriota bacterium]